ELLVRQGADEADVDRREPDGQGDPGQDQVVGPLHRVLPEGDVAGEREQLGADREDVQAEQLSLGRLVAELVGDHGGQPEDRDRHTQDGDDPARDVAERPRPRPAVGPDGNGAGEPDHRRAEHEGGGGPQGRPQDLRYRAALDVGKAEVPAQQAPEEGQVLPPVGLIEAEVLGDQGDLRLGRGLARDPLGWGGPGEPRDDVEQQPGQQGDDEDLDQRAQDPGPGEPDHRRPLGSSASLIPSPSRLNASMVMTSAAPGTRARPMSVWYMPEVTASDSIWPQLGVGGGTPTP